MAKRILNRKDLRADFDAAERRKDDEEEEVEAEDEEEDDEEDEEEDEAEEEAEDEEEGEEEEEDEEGALKKKRKPAKAKPAKAAKPAKPAKAPKAPKAKRTRTPKVVRMRVVWGVFNNSNQMVASYDYPKRNEAKEHAARLTADKRSTHFIQPVKEAIEEKKEKEK
jgi:cobalamin biosynthesis protein CobT